MPLVPSRVRLLAILALAVAVLHPQPSDASLLHERSLALSGTRGAAMTWSTGRDLTIMLNNSHESCAQADAVVRLGGKYAAVDIRDRAGTLVLQAWAVRGVGFAGTSESTSACPYLVTTPLKSDTPVTPTYVRLPRGTYTVSFLTDAPSSIRFTHVKGTPHDLDLRPTRRAPTPEVTYEQKTTTVSSFTDHVRVRPGTFGVTLLDIRQPGPVDVTVNEGCFAPEESSCDPDETDLDTASTAGFATGSTSYRLVRPGQYAPGAYVSNRDGATTHPFPVMTFFTYFSRY